MGTDEHLDDDSPVSDLDESLHARECDEGGRASRSTQRLPPRSEAASSSRSTPRPESLDDEDDSDSENEVEKHRAANRDSDENDSDDSDEDLLNLRGKRAKTARGQRKEPRSGASGAKQKKRRCLPAETAGFATFVAGTVRVVSDERNAISLRALGKPATNAKLAGNGQSLFAVYEHLAEASDTPPKGFQDQLDGLKARTTKGSGVRMLHGLAIETDLDSITKLLKQPNLQPILKPAIAQAVKAADREQVRAYAQQVQSMLLALKSKCKPSAKKADRTARSAATQKAKAAAKAATTAEAEAPQTAAGEVAGRAGAATRAPTAGTTDGMDDAGDADDEEQPAGDASFRFSSTVLSVGREHSERSFDAAILIAQAPDGPFGASPDQAKAWVAGLHQVRLALRGVQASTERVQATAAQAPSKTPLLGYNQQRMVELAIKHPKALKRIRDEQAELQKELAKAPRPRD